MVYGLVYSENKRSPTHQNVDQELFQLVNVSLISIVFPCCHIHHRPVWNKRKRKTVHKGKRKNTAHIRKRKNTAHKEENFTQREGRGGGGGGQECTQREEKNKGTRNKLPTQRKKEKCTPNPNLEAQAFKTFCRLQHSAGRLTDC